MNRLWLREYEILLSSNRREERSLKEHTACRLYDRPQTAKTAQKKKKKKNSVPSGGDDEMGSKQKSEDQLATEILAISTRGEYRRTAPELLEKKYGTLKYSQSTPSKSPFGRLHTLEEYEGRERQREMFLTTGDERIFREIYPPISPNFHPRTTSAREQRQQVRPKSSPVRVNARSVVEALLKSTDEPQITPQDLQITVAPVEPEIAQQAQGMWQALISEVWSSGQCILYADLTAFASSWQKTPTSRHIVRYLCALFGLKTHSSHLLVLGAERSLFRELLPLLKYLREVNPLTVPRKRLLKARSIHEKYFVPLNEEHSLQATDSESRLHISPLDQKFLRWVEAFNQVLTIVLHASIHQTLLENDAIDYAQETLQSLQRKEQQQFVAQPTDASLVANQRYSGVKKKHLPPSSAQQPPPDQLFEPSATSSTPSLELISLTGVLQIEEILPVDERRRHTSPAIGLGLSRMRSIEEELGAGEAPSPQSRQRSARLAEPQASDSDNLLAAEAEAGPR